MSNDRSDLHKAFIEAYPPYVIGVLERRGVPVTTVVADAIVEGVSVLDGLLTSFDRTEPNDQRHSPLELFSEALRPVDHALDVEGIRPVSASETGVRAWDRYGLAPGSSQVLGPEAHEAHLAWGIAKASALAPMVVRPTMRIETKAHRVTILEDVARSLGYSIADGGSAPSVVIVDLGVPDAHDSVRRGVVEGAFVVAFGDRIDDLETIALRALGASVVVATDALLEDPAAHLPAVT